MNIINLIPLLDLFTKINIILGLFCLGLGLFALYLKISQFIKSKVIKKENNNS